MLAIPLDLSFAYNIRNGAEGHMIIGWLFGLVRIPVRLNQGKEKKAEKRKTKVAKKGPKSRKALRLLSNRDFWPWLNRLIKRLLGRIKIYSLSLKMRLGLGDPADTGRLWAVAGQHRARLHACRAVSGKRGADTYLRVTADCRCLVHSTLPGNLAVVSDEGGKLRRHCSLGKCRHGVLYPRITLLM